MVLSCVLRADDHSSCFKGYSPLQGTVWGRVGRVYKEGALVVHSGKFSFSFYQYPSDAGSITNLLLISTVCVLDNYPKKKNCILFVENLKGE